MSWGCSYHQTRLGKKILRWATGGSVLRANDLKVPTRILKHPECPLRGVARVTGCDPGFDGGHRHDYVWTLRPGSARLQPTVTKVTASDVIEPRRLCETTPNVSQCTSFNMEHSDTLNANNNDSFVLLTPVGPLGTIFSCGESWSQRFVASSRYTLYIVLVLMSGDQLDRSLLNQN